MAIIATMSSFIDEAARLNVYKSLLFYGKEKPMPKTHLYSGANLAGVSDPKRLHALLGIASEAGELLENLFRELERKAVLTGQEQEDIDANYSEESGDIDWFQEQLAKSIRIPVEASRRDNIEKLRKRYPEKFTVEAAIARADKKAEMDFEDDWERDNAPSEEPDPSDGVATFNDTMS